MIRVGGFRTARVELARRAGGRRVVRRALVAALGATSALAILPATSGAQEPHETGRAPERLPDRYIVVYRPSVDRPGAETNQLEREAGFDSTYRYDAAVEGFAAELSPADRREVGSDPQVAFVSPDRPVEALSEPLAAGEPTPPAGVRRIEAAEGGSVHEAGSGNVAVIDSGIDLSHKDLNAAAGTNCVSPGAAPQDDNGHGTHVAGTVGGRNDGAGVTGVAPGTKLYAVKVLDSAGSGTWSQVICGIDWVTGTRTDGDPGNDVSVANMSLGGTGTPVESCSWTTDALHKAICRSTAAGVTYVVAAGNSGWDFDYAAAPDVPAAYPQVLTVTAVSDSDGQPGGTGPSPQCSSDEVDDRYASFSNFAATSAGAAHTIAAPGTCIASTWTGGSYETISGTSMAAPHVAGAAALCVGEGGASGPCADLAPADIIKRMRSEAEAYSATHSGYGFAGDPTKPVGGAYFGHLTWAGIIANNATDPTAPTVTNVAPADRATTVPVTRAVSVSFSEPMDQAATERAFSLTRESDGAAVSGSFSWSDDTLTFTPSAPLVQGTRYVARVAGAESSSPAKDAAGNPLAEAKSWSFATAVTKAAFPSATVIQGGNLRSGSYSRLSADDNRYYEVNSTTSGTTRNATWYGRFYSIPNQLQNLRVIYKGKASRTTSQTVSVWRWSTNSWVHIDSRSVGTTEPLVDQLPGENLDDYVSGSSGSGELRVRVRASASASFYTSGDLMSIRYDVPGA